MDADSREARAKSFGGVAEIYERARPEYPSDAIAWLVPPPPADVVDLGAGTGKQTRQLVSAGHRVRAVEPSSEMLAQLERAVRGARALIGSAERIPLPDGAADAVVAAQAFHWFDHELALPEIARVLRPGGRLALIWNSRDRSEPWIGRLSAVIGAEPVDDVEVAGAVGASGLFEAVEYETFAHEQRLDRETLLALVASRSYCATRAPEERARVLDEVGRLFDEVAAGAPEVVVPYVTHAFRAGRAR